MFPIDIDFVLVLEERIFEKRWIIDFLKETMHFINCRDCLLIVGTLTLNLTF